MTRKLWLASLLLLLAAVPAIAGGINLYWSDCGNGAPPTFQSFNCASNTGSPMNLVVSVIPPAPLENFATAEFRVSSMVQSATLPPWWQAGLGQCREGAITASFDFNAFPSLSCLDAWGGQTATGSTTITQDVAQAMWRLTASAAIAAPVAITPEMVDTDELVVGFVRITRARSSGPDACAGCLNGACFALERVTLADASGQNTFILTTPAANAWVYYNTGAPSLCYVPNVNRTWGAIKSLYR